MNILHQEKILEDNLSFDEFSEQLQHSPIPPEEMERFKDEARSILKQRGIRNYSQKNLLDVMYHDLYILAHYRV